MKNPLEELQEIMGRDGWEVLKNLKAEFVADRQRRIASSCRSNDGKHQLHQGEVDGVNDFFDTFLEKKLEGVKKATAALTQVSS